MEQTLRSLELFRVQLEQEMETAALEAETTDKLLEQMTLEEIRKRVEEQNSPPEEMPEKTEEVPEVTVIVGPIEIQ